MRYLTFALAKGRLAKKTLALLEQIGITCEEMKDPDTRKLIFVNEELKMKFFLSKATDVPTYVEYGAADIGVVGKDTILEEGRNLYEVMDLGFGKCRMCVCGPASARELLKKNEIIRVASKYPVIAKDYFNNCGLLRLDLRSDYEKQDTIEDILGIIIPETRDMFACEMIATKAVSIAQERIQALEHMGFCLSEEALIGHDGTKYNSYYVREV